MMMVALILTGIVAAEHVYILVLEMFWWTTPRGLKAFGNTQELANASKVLAANQGLYNGFLAAGLFWGLLHNDPNFAFQIKIFFLLCVIVAGIYGGLTASKKIIVIQALPAALAFIATLAAQA